MTSKKDSNPERGIRPGSALFTFQTCAWTTWTHLDSLGATARLGLAHPREARYGLAY